MKKKLLKSILLSTLISTFGMGTVFAATTPYEEQSTNVSDYSLNIKIKEKESVGATSYLEIEGIKTSAINNNYYVKFVEKDATKPVEFNKNTINNQTGLSIDSYITFDETTDGRYIASINDEIYLLNRDYYAYVYNCTKKEDYTTYCKVTTDTPIKVEKEAMPNFTERYQIFFFGNTTVTTPWADLFTHFPSYYGDRLTIPLNVKVGIIEDESVIRAMAQKASGAREKLYNYAKNATNGINYSTELHEARDIDISNLTVQDGKFYYVYIDIEDPENKYIDVSDAIIVMGESGMLVNELKYGEYENIDYKDYEYACYACTNEYVWTAKGYQANTCTLVDSITEKSKCVKNAKTGVEDYLVPGAIVLLVGGAFVTLLSKKSHFKKI